MMADKISLDQLINDPMAVAGMNLVFHEEFPGIA
jgi:hypothetical protein